MQAEIGTENLTYISHSTTFPLSIVYTMDLKITHQQG